jgi:ABC-2 type transport system ATP-binding protein
VAEGTPEQLKRDIAGDVISLGVGSELERALAVLEMEPYVRKASIEGDGLRLYVDRGEAAMPSVPRLLDSSGFDLAGDLQ